MDRVYKKIKNNTQNIIELDKSSLNCNGNSSRHINYRPGGVLSTFREHFAKWYHGEECIPGSEIQMRFGISFWIFSVAFIAMRFFYTSSDGGLNVRLSLVYLSHVPTLRHQFAKFDGFLIFVDSRVFEYL